MGRVYPVGHRRTTVPVPPVEAATIYIEAGAVLFGVEFREVNDAIMAEHLAQDAEAFAAHWAVREELGVAAGEAGDRGASIHVFDAASRAEYLRFDMFDEDPHYHYITPGVGHLAVAFDAVANLHYSEWALMAIRYKLPEMLREAGADALADKVDQAAVEAASVAIERAVRLVTAG